MKIDEITSKENAKNFIFKRMKSPEFKVTASTEPTTSAPPSSPILTPPSADIGGASEGFVTPTSVSSHKRMKLTGPSNSLVENVVKANYDPSRQSTVPPTDASSSAGGDIIKPTQLSAKQIEDIFRTPPSPLTSITVDGIQAYFLASPAAALSQRKQMELAFPEDLRRESLKLTAQAAHNSFVQNTYMAFNSSYDMIVRQEQFLKVLADEEQMKDAALRKLAESDKKNSALSAQLQSANSRISELEKELAAKDIAEKTLKDANAALEKAVGDVSKDRNMALDAKAAAELNFAKLRQHLPFLGQKIMDSHYVNDPFSAHACALQVLARAELLRDLALLTRIPDPLPAHLAEIVEPLPLARELAQKTKEEIATISIPPLDTISVREDATADEIINLDLSSEVA